MPNTIKYRLHKCYTPLTTSNTYRLKVRFSTNYLLIRYLLVRIFNKIIYYHYAGASCKKQQISINYDPRQANLRGYLVKLCHFQTPSVNNSENS